jgi:GT2 family glycosyltransferase
MEEKSNRIVSIIVTYSIKDYLCSCLDSIKEQTYPEYEIIVIDNLDDKNFSQGIIKHYPEVRLYPQKKKISYCEALNLGIKQSTGDFTLCLNDDVILDKRFIEEALRGFFINSKIGIVSGKILRNDRKTLDSTGLFLSLWLTAKERDYGLRDKGQFEKEEYVFGVNGAVAFYRKEMLEDIKEGDDYFDSDFHFFYEDLDIAWRAQRSGWRGYYVPGAVAYHIRGGTARASYGRGKSFARRYLSNELHLDLIKNRYLTIIKNETCLGFLLHLPFILLYDFVVWGYILLFRPKIIKNFLLNLIYFKNALRKRVFGLFSRR